MYKVLGNTLAESDTGGWELLTCVISYLNQQLPVSTLTCMILYETF